MLAAILSHLFIAWMHPFGNGDGRTARLVGVQILSESGVVPLVALVRRENLQVHWESYVHQIFNDKPSTDARKRQKAVVLHLQQGQVVTPEEVISLSGPIARFYALAGPRIPARD
ncbi:MAG TPA: hypothetical protein VK816_09555, partial [Jatrophihabitantaceae bacterium]|nr:hypothetical protein [Jatrophihabitantaceae bacterium]